HMQTVHKPKTATTPKSQTNGEQRHHEYNMSEQDEQQMDRSTSTIGADEQKPAISSTNGSVN
ncbi:unnamed protein product, partial [Didymodactylos carnosus]